MSPTLVVPVLVRIALCGAPAEAVQSEAWARAHVDGANQVLAAAGIRLEARFDTFTPPSCELLDRAARDGLSVFVADDGEAGARPTVTVLVPRRIKDLDVPDYDLAGVHWRAGGRHWVYLTARAQPPVLAHELSHFFGLGHDTAGGNLMTPGPSSPAWRSAKPPRPYAPVLTPSQVRKLRAGVARWLKASAPASPRTPPPASRANAR